MYLALPLNTLNNLLNRSVLSKQFYSLNWTNPCSYTATMHIVLKIGEPYVELGRVTFDGLAVITAQENSKINELITTKNNKTFNTPATYL